MFRVYISCVPRGANVADGRYLEAFKKVIRPLQLKYCLHLWHDHAPLKPLPLPFPFSLFFRKKPLPFHPELPARVQEANLYLFLTSSRSLAETHINWLETDTALARRHEFSEKFVRLFQIPIVPCEWKHSRLGAFPPMPDIFNKKNRAIGDPGDKRQEWKHLAHLPTGWWSDRGDVLERYGENWQQLVLALEPVVAEMRQNLLEDTQAKGLSTDSFFEQQPDDWWMGQRTGWEYLVFGVAWGTMLTVCFQLIFGVADWLEGLRDSGVPIAWTN